MGEISMPEKKMISVILKYDLKGFLSKGKGVARKLVQISGTLNTISQAVSGLA